MSENRVIGPQDRFLPFLEWVRREFGNAVAEECGRRLADHPETDPFAVLDDVRFALDRSEPFDFGTVRYDS